MYICILVPDQAYKHNEIANAINCKFMNLSASMEPLDYSNLPASYKQGIYHHVCTHGMCIQF